MLRRILAPLVCFGALAAQGWAGAPVMLDGKSAKKMVTPMEEVQTDLFSTEFDFVNSSSLRGDDKGKGDSNELYYYASYGHRTHLNGNFYLRLGVGYERFDFGTTEGPTPNHLQGLFFPVALEYIVQGVAAAAFEITPGWWFQNDIEGDAFDIPFRLYGTIPLRDKKLYLVAGVAGASFYNIKAFPVGGLIYLVNDKVRVEAVFPRPAIIYAPNEQWDYRLEGELKGGGYRVGDADMDKYDHTRVQFVDYRAGGLITYKGLKNFQVGVGAGWSFRREFYFYSSDKYLATTGSPYVKIQATAAF